MCVRVPDGIMVFFILYHQFIVLFGNKCPSVQKIPFADRAGNSGFLTQCGTVSGNTLSLFKEPCKTKAQLKSDTLFSGVRDCNAASVEGAFTVESSSIDGGQFTFASSNSCVFQYEPETNVTLNGNPSHFSVHGASIDSAENISGGYRLYFGDSTIDLLTSDSTISIRDRSSSSYRTYNLVSKTYGSA